MQACISRRKNFLLLARFRSGAAAKGVSGSQKSSRGCRGVRDRPLSPPSTRTKVSAKGGGGNAAQSPPGRRTSCSTPTPLAACDPPARRVAGRAPSGSHRRRAWSHVGSWRCDASSSVRQRHSQRRRYRRAGSRWL